MLGIGLIEKNVPSDAPGRGVPGGSRFPLALPRPFFEYRRRALHLLSVGSGARDAAEHELLELEMERASQAGISGFPLISTKAQDPANQDLI